MPINTPSSTQPPQDSLVVCAGTVTCSSVSGMGSGFMLFKKLFDQNTSVDNLEGGWVKELQTHLDDFHHKNKVMPAYKRFAKQREYIGGIATVPDRSSRIGLTFDRFTNNDERDEHFKTQYKQAIVQAIVDAKELKRPLFIQPLGIGVYGWDPKIAAQLFVEAITETDPDDQLDITIPIFNSTTNSNDMIFKETLAKELNEKKKKVESKAIVHETPQLIPHEEPQPIVHEEPQLLAAEAQAIVNHKTKLIDIITVLIHNIESKNSGRWTSGVNSEKIKLLMQLKNTIKQEQDPITPKSALENKYLHDIMSVCTIRRNPIHFWATPHSVKEFKLLLVREGLEMPSDNKTLRPT